MREQGTIIVRRKSRHKGEGSHGGAWKVAFADFALAMMALFLVLWILSVSSEQERESVATKLRDYSVFEGSTSPYLLGGTPFPVDVQGQPLAQIPGQATELQDISLATEPLQSPADLHPGRVESEQDKRRLAILIGELARREGMENNLELNIVPEGLRIRIHDQADKPMFTRGSARMEQHFEQLLHALAPVFEKVENRLVISGHTDSVRYASQHYSNWDLSGARAQNVRQLLELAGVPRNRVLQVVAMAEQAPFDVENPTSGHNRRVELLLLSKEAEKLLQTLFDAGLTDGIFNKQQQSARVQEQAATVIQ
ncbi:flagellar motor protein MotB [Oceanimonas baumannii]|uniref:Chemotaxis protein MotB n=1 Tax=Oceanimonas baumannii TaxID=129578 RepID=A0A235CMK4_9GAMM|nr:flagellar motor protein MotB [Oceanimonas baumannii]OYD25798.1 protein LafU [Oceanimonas baumannii]TDW60190.1 chemotaxis protein MotB [Oceanimonas baumannii]